MKRPALATLAATVTLAFGLAACAPPASEGDSAEGSVPDKGEWETITIEHKFGETVIEERPERVATVDFANQDVPLALGVVPVGMSKMTWGDDGGEKGNGIQPWVEDVLEELDAEEPVLYDETDGYDYEAVGDTNPDVILAGYSGMDQKAYDELSEIAGVVPYPEVPWGTPWRETIEINSAALGMADEGDELVADLEDLLAETREEFPELEGKTGMFLTHVDPSDLSEVNFYNANDTRVKFLEDLGMEIAPSIVEATEDGTYSGSISTENADALADVDVIVTYGGDDLIKALEGDPVLARLPAVKNGAIVNLDGSKPIGTAANPTALSMPALTKQYAALLADAVSYLEQ